MAELNVNESADARARYADGWHFDFRGQAVGPVSFQELTHRYASGELKPSDLVWHPTPARWIAMRDVARVLGLHETQEASGADPAILRRLVASSDGPIRNPILLAATSLAAVFSFFIASQTLSSFEGDFLGPIFLMLSIILAWWAWLEYRGVQLDGGSVIYPLRLPYLPVNLAYWPSRIDKSSINSATFLSIGKSTHCIILDTDKRKIRLVFETPFLRDMVLAILSFAQVRILKT